MLASKLRAGTSGEPRCGGWNVFSFGLFGILYYALMAALLGLAVYALVLVTIFLRLRIRELKASQRPGPGAGSRS